MAALAARATLAAPFFIFSTGLSRSSCSFFLAFLFFHEPNATQVLNFVLYTFVHSWRNRPGAGFRSALYGGLSRTGFFSAITRSAPGSVLMVKVPLPSSIPSAVIGAFGVDFTLSFRAW